MKKLSLKNRGFLFGKLRAGALQYTIAFSLLIILIIFSFLLFSHLRRVELGQYNVLDNLSRDIRSASLILEGKPDFFAEYQGEIKLDYEGLQHETTVKIDAWGFLNHVTITASHRNNKKRKDYLYADDIHKNTLKPSLYFSDPRKHLSISGNTYLGKNTYLPAKGVRKVYMNGIRYQRDSLVFGKTYKAEPQLPKLRSRWNNMYTELLNGISGSDSTVHWNELKNDSIINSFSNKRLLVQCPAGTVIDGKYIYGKIVFWGEDIKIEKTSRLDACIVLAKTLKIEPGFSGSAQFIANKSIEIGSSSSLNYPSFLFCSVSAKGEGIFFEDECKVFGDIISTSPKTSYEVLKTGKGTKIAGQVYCNGLITFHGAVLGSMYCRGFVDRTRDGVFSNYIYDVCVDYGRLPNEYTSVSLISIENGKTCIQEVI